MGYTLGCLINIALIMVSIRKGTYIVEDKKDLLAAVICVAASWGYTIAVFGFWLLFRK